jgi:hypothetical protein
LNPKTGAFKIKVISFHLQSFESNADMIAFYRWEVRPRIHAIQSWISIRHWSTATGFVTIEAASWRT